MLWHALVLGSAGLVSTITLREGASAPPLSRRLPRVMPLCLPAPCKRAHTPTHTHIHPHTHTHIHTRKHRWYENRSCARWRHRQTSARSNTHQRTHTCTYTHPHQRTHASNPQHNKPLPNTNSRGHAERERQRSRERFTSTPNLQRCCGCKGTHQQCCLLQKRGAGKNST